jgi:hypothetical protein
MKRPSFQFYPGDWLRSADLRACSIGARGLWLDMLCLMHEGSPYGYLRVGNLVIHAVNLAPIVGCELTDVERWLSELSTAGVLSMDPTGCIFSRRMVRDERMRELRASGGKLGGNPALVNPKDKQIDNLAANLRANLTSARKVKHEDKQDANQKPTPASASAFKQQGFNTTTKNETRARVSEVKTVGPEGPFKTNGNGKPHGVTVDFIADDWWLTSSGIEAKGKELGLTPQYRETTRAFKDRIFKALQQRKATP